MRILFAGDNWYGSNARSLADGFRAAGHEVVVVDTTAVTVPTRGTPAWWYAKRTGERSPATVDRVHRELADCVAALRPDLLFCYKTVHLDQARLLSLPVPVKVHYSADDVTNPYNTTPAYLEREAEWDAVVTTKAHNVPELDARGVARVIHVFSAYDPAWHRPVARRGPVRYDAGFIGAMRPDRTEFLIELAGELGDRFYLAGPGWRRNLGARTSGARIAGPQYGEELSAAIATIGANLVLLNSDNRDTHTCRTFEVPAAAGLVVGERTVEHEALFDDGREAYLFDSHEELAEILRRCAAAPDEAAAVAARGHRRIVEGGHTYRDRAEQIHAALG
ncbi:hypothetical protein TTY48_40020 [Tsukamurella sp. TY48]|uniref:CgeB family protein n=1 Tax=Tsukamurella TaxID=2060 RepID=UPI001C7E119A|nr:glycosyltransferase [Tsukamurella sp. TY48]GIZ99390.1 hypothetical protein TTY48_40020 [Tsukamurella sp. TY48]